mmetsp:Transcript_162040/g.519551  ORF Transcript_162040/g.519551 Transcript_162040/m.519551 type:complete len:285 (+) Transcript_162040:12-866(+)
MSIALAQADLRFIVSVVGQGNGHRSVREHARRSPAPCFGIRDRIPASVESMAGEAAGPAASAPVPGKGLWRSFAACEPRLHARRRRRQAAPRERGLPAASAAARRRGGPLHRADVRRAEVPGRRGAGAPGRSATGLGSRGAGFAAGAAAGGCLGPRLSQDDTTIAAWRRELPSWPPVFLEFPRPSRGGACRRRAVPRPRVARARGERARGAQGIAGEVSAGHGGPGEFAGPARRRAKRAAGFPLLAGPRGPPADRERGARPGQHWADHDGEPPDEGLPAAVGQK